jgi:hypothetical protein
VKVVEKYNRQLEEKILKQRLIARTGQVYTSGLRGKEAKATLDIINTESKQYSIRVVQVEDEDGDLVEFPLRRWSTK